MTPVGRNAVVSLDDCATNSAAFLIEDVFRIALILLAEKCESERLRDQLVVHVIPEPGAMKLVGTTLDLNVDSSAAGESLLGREAVRNYVYRFNRFKRRHISSDVRQPGRMAGGAVDTDVDTRGRSEERRVGKECA